MDDARAQLREGGWGHAIGAFERHYSGWRIEGGFEAFGYQARRKVDGRPRGPRLLGRTLDELAAAIEAAPPPTE